jgi:hypothetical protein
MTTIDRLRVYEDVADEMHVRGGGENAFDPREVDEDEPDEEGAGLGLGLPSPAVAGDVVGELEQASIGEAGDVCFALGVGATIGGCRELAVADGMLFDPL